MAVLGAQSQLACRPAPCGCGAGPTWPRVEEAEGALEDLKRLNPDLGFVEANLRRLCFDQTAIDHVLDGLRAAGFD
jgi:hypothetical protein